MSQGNKKLAVGDVVRLKSGGPRMTVDYINSEGDPVCAWFWEGALEHDKSFKAATVVPAPVDDAAVDDDHDNKSLAVGDVARLRSGGPRMTIASIDDHPTAWCYWFDSGRLNRQQFSLEALMPAPAQDHDQDEHEDEYE